MFKVYLYPNEWLLPTTAPFMWSFIAYFITRPKNDVEGYEMVINPHAQLQRGNQRAWHWYRSKTINPHLLSFLSFNNLVLESTRKKSFLSGNDLKYCPSFSPLNGFCETLFQAQKPLSKAHSYLKLLAMTSPVVLIQGSGRGLDLMLSS